MTEKKELNTKYVTPEIICSFPYLFEISDYTGKFGLSIPIKTDQEEEIKKIKTLIGNAAENKWGKKARVEVGKKIKSPLRDGNEEKEGNDEVYKDAVFFSANSAKRPGVVDNKVQPLMDQDEIYPGCIIRASVNFYAYDYKGKKGVACGLQNVMKVKDGEPIGGKTTPEDDFAGYATENTSEENGTDDVF
ncbi:MAG: DUF2815 domain-containing protein [Deltaproteobacteria bacterium]|nr:MAG: DUF2815 domain-containing protein [Deltaproteobacteria bacterium]